jgi:hypothetical protein
VARWPRPAPGLAPLLRCPSRVPAAAGRGLGPRVFPAQVALTGRRPLPQLQAPSTSTTCALARAATAHPLAMRLQTGKGFLHMPIFTIRPVFVPIQTGAPAQIRAADRPPGTPAVLPGRYVASVNHTGLLRRSPRCSVIAHAATAVLSDRLRFCMCGLVLCGSSVGQSRRKNALPHPGREPRDCLHAGGEQRGHLAAPGGLTKWGGHREAKGLSHLILVR